MRLNQNCYRRLVVFLALAAFAAFSSLAEAASWSFAVLGDQRDNYGTYGVNAPVVQAMVNDIVQNRGVSLALVGGDQIHGIFATPPSPQRQAPLPKMYQNWRSAMGPLLRKSFPVRGNHETYGEIYTSNKIRGFPWTYGRNVPYPFNWLNYVVRYLPQIPQNGPNNEQCLTYSFTNQGACFIALDQFVPDNEYRINQAWLDQQLAANILPHVFVYAHAPAVSVSGPLAGMSIYPLQRDAFWESLSAAGAQVYLCGHSHLYNHATVQITDINGRSTNVIHQLIAGGGGGPLDKPWDGIYYPYQPQGGQPDPKDLPGSQEAVTTTLVKHLEQQYGYAIVTVDGNQVSITYYAGYNPVEGVPTSWQPFDHYSYTVTSKTLGMNDVNQAIDPQILTNFYPGIDINKTGNGALTFNKGNSTYSGAITVAGGALLVSGSYAAAPVTVQTGAQVNLLGGSLGKVTVNTGGILAGPGAVAGNLTNNGNVHPNLPTGPWNLQVTGNYTQDAKATLMLDIASASNYGSMQVDGAVNLDGDLFLASPSEYRPAVGQSYTIITASGGVNGTFKHIIGPGSETWDVSYSGNAVTLTVLQAGAGED